MSSFSIREFTADDIPQIMALQKAYQQAYPNAVIIPGEVYLSPGFEEGKNIFCAFDERGTLQGYAPQFPNITEDPHIPHTIWAEIKVNPRENFPVTLKDILFERVKQRSRKIISKQPMQHVQLAFQYHPSEKASIEFILSRGFKYAESVYRMMHDLAQELHDVPRPEDIDFRLSRMENPQEQQAYIQAQNEAFPEAPITLADWKAFISSNAWQDGRNITAFDGQEV